MSYYCARHNHTSAGRDCDKCNGEAQELHQQTNKETKDNAKLLIQTITNSLKEGIKFFDKEDGRQLTTVKDVLESLVKKQSVEMDIPEELKPVFEKLVRGKG